MPKKQREKLKDKLLNQTLNQKEDKMNKAIRILLVGHNEFLRHELSLMLASENDIVIIGDCTSAKEVLSQTATLHPDIILMDKQLPDMDGIEATRHLKRNGLHYDGDVIVLADCADYQIEALDAGAALCIDREQLNRTELLNAIKQVYHLKHSVEQHNIFEETVELVVPPPVDSAQLFRFVCEIDELLESKGYNKSLQQMVGSWKRGTTITVLLGHNKLANLLNDLRKMPDVEQMEEQRPAIGGFPNHPSQSQIKTKSRACTRSRLLITLKQLGVEDRNRQTCGELAQATAPALWSSV